ncbi:hypothetical protein PMI0981 [Proteus mirabilis HI4320]|uniref:Uncharacterized protein n=1 Tax=Proteus mirabilis (strain HI4320) TaxID=529507 RepID=B4EVK5_PROMH|nr:hypothetical protein PMI0981 [Proteus mirabilis HI4320]
MPYTYYLTLFKNNYSFCLIRYKKTRKQKIKSILSPHISKIPAKSKLH